MKNTLVVTFLSGALLVSANAFAGTDVCDISDSGCVSASSDAPKQAAVQTLGQSYLPAPAPAVKLAPMPTTTTEAPAPAVQNYIPPAPPLPAPAPNYNSYNYYNQRQVPEQPMTYQRYQQQQPQQPAYNSNPYIPAPPVESSYGYNSGSEYYSRCQQSFAAHGYRLNSTMLSQCNNIRSVYGLQALDYLTATVKQISGRDMASVLRIRNNEGAECVRLITQAGVDFSANDRMAVCADQAVSPEGTSALQVFLSQTQSGRAIEPTDDQLVNLLRYRNDSGVTCLRLFAGMGYRLNYGNRIGLCRMFVNDNQLSALRAQVSTGGGVTDATVQAILQGRLGY